MKPPNSVLAGETDALGGDPRPCAIVPRPIPCLQTSATTVIGGAR